MGGIFNLTALGFAIVGLTSFVFRVSYKKHLARLDGRSRQASKSKFRAARASIEGEMLTGGLLGNGSADR